MDKKPFVEWQVLSEELPPHDFLTLLHKAQYNAELVRTFAQQRYQKNLLVEQLSCLLEPSPEFTKLAIGNIETRNLTVGVVDSWKPVVKAAIDEWAKQQRLSSVLGEGVTTSAVNDAPRKARAVVTTQEELDGFAAVQRLLGPNRPVAYEDTASYFKVHLPGKPFWAVCRLNNFGDRQPSISVPLPPERVSALVASLDVSPQGKRWSRIALSDCRQIDFTGPALCAAWDTRSATYGSGDEDDDAIDG